MSADTYRTLHIYRPGPWEWTRDTWLSLEQTVSHLNESGFDAAAHRLPSTGQSSLTLVQHTASLLRKQRPHIAHGYGEGGVPLRLAAVRARGRRLLQEWQGLNGGSGQFLEGAWTGWRERQLARLPGGLIFGSQELQRQFADEGIAAGERGIVLERPLQLDAYREAARQSTALRRLRRDAYHLSLNHRLVLVLLPVSEGGWHGPALNLLSAVMARTRQFRVPLKWLVVMKEAPFAGNQPAIQHRPQLVRSLMAAGGQPGLAAGRRWDVAEQDAELPVLMAAADLAFFPDPRSDFPALQLRAAAAGLPLLAVHAPLIEVAVSEFQNGFVVATGDSEAAVKRMEFLFSSHGALPAFRNASREQVEGRWHWDPYWQRLLKLYRGLVGAD